MPTCSHLGLLSKVAHNGRLSIGTLSGDSFALAMTEVMQVYHKHYSQGLCTAIGWLVMYSRWVKLLFTMWVSFHLFGFGVLHKNLKKLEPLYVFTSLLVPLVVACIPLITHTYGVTPFGGCFLHGLNGSQRVALIEEFSLWDAPSMALLLASSAAMIIMVVKLTRIVCFRLRYETIDDGDQFWKALKQLLPLAAFPILFFTFQIPMLIYHIYSVYNTAINDAILISITVFVALWTMSSGITLITHIAVARYLARRRDRTNPVVLHSVKDFPHDHMQDKGSSRRTIDEEGFITFAQESKSIISSATHFSMPKHSCEYDGL